MSSEDIVVTGSAPVSCIPRILDPVTWTLSILASWLRGSFGDPSLLCFFAGVLGELFCGTTINVLSDVFL